MKELRPHDSKPPREARPPNDIPPADDIDTQMAELQTREDEIRRQRDDLREQLWKRLVTEGRTLADRVRRHSFNLATYAKACGFGASSNKKPKKAKGGPTTLEGWIAVYRGSGIQGYFRKHPGESTKLKSAGIPVSDYAQHVPADALKLIEDHARAKAAKRFPEPTAA